MVTLAMSQNHQQATGQLPVKNKNNESERFLRWACVFMWNVYQFWLFEQKEKTVLHAYREKRREVDLIRKRKDSA